MIASVIHPRELLPDQRRRWLELLRAAPHLRSPYFHPDFAADVGRVRDDARIAMFFDSRAGDSLSSPSAFLTFQQQGTKARPLAGRLSDYQGLIRSDAWSCDAETMLRSLGLTTLEFDHWVQQDAELAGYAWLTDGSPLMRLGGGWSEYARRRLRPQSSETATAQRKARKLQKELGALRFEFHAVHRESVFQQLLQWKSDQYRRTHVTDVFAYDWTVNLMRRLLQHDDPSFQGVLSALYAGDRLVAAHLGMRSAGVLHYWFPAYDVALAAYSPGLALLLQLIEQADEHQLDTLDLGRGMARYKMAFMTDVRYVNVGAVDLRPLTKQWRGSWRAVKAWVKQSPLRGPAKLPGKMMYRLREWMAFRA